MDFDTFTLVAYLVAASLFILGLRDLSSPTTARRGNVFGASGMLLAIVVTLLQRGVLNYGMIIAGMAIGAAIGALLATRIRMTAMPQMVGLLNGFGGGASALVAVADFTRASGAVGALAQGRVFSDSLGVLVGAVTLTGSLVAFAKLQEVVIGSRPILLPARNILNAAIFVAILAMGAYLLAAPDGAAAPFVFWALVATALLLGFLLVIPIGGADMPVVISLLNSYSGVAASIAGFILGNTALIVSGALVGAAGLILTQIMSKAMNRSLANIIFGGFGAVSAGAAAAGAGEKVARSGTPVDAAMMVAYARSVIFVPGYGLAVAQAQHAAAELANELEKRGVEVKFAIHPVAGRMPGHMNVLLAEANVPYDKLYDLDQVNNDFERADVAIVVGANDVTNPDARNVTNSPIYGMPILNVDKARSVVVIKRSLAPGFAGIDNPLFYMDKTMMLFMDAKKGLADIVTEMKAL